MMTYTQALERILESLDRGEMLQYAKTYAHAGLTDPDANRTPDARRVQILYILNNIRYWRGPTAKAVRAALKHYRDHPDDERLMQ